MTGKLKTLYNALCEISTKGNDTLIMSDCLKFTRQCIDESAENEKQIKKLENKIKDMELRTCLEEDDKK